DGEAVLAGWSRFAEGKREGVFWTGHFMCQDVAGGCASPPTAGYRRERGRARDGGTKEEFFDAQGLDQGQFDRFYRFAVDRPFLVHNIHIAESYDRLGLDVEGHL